MFTRIWIANDPVKVEWGSDAKGVAGQIEFWDELFKQQKITIAGRWAETKQFIQGGEPLNTKAIDIPSNASPYCMDIGIKYHNEDEFYAYNDESQSKGNGGRNQQRKLDRGNYIVLARFRCKGVDTSFYFKLYNPGKGSDAQLKSIAQPIPDKEGYQN